jgi:hypothetical protein
MNLKKWNKLRLLLVPLIKIVIQLKKKMRTLWMMRKIKKLSLKLRNKKKKGVVVVVLVCSMM